MRNAVRTILLTTIVFMTGCGQSRSVETPPAPADIATLKAQMKLLEPHFSKLGPPKEGEWLAQHKEAGQSFQQWLDSDPVTATGERKTLYILPVGDFEKTQRKIVSESADFMQRYFGLTVKVLDDLPLSEIPDKARRVHPTWGVKQILSTYVLNDVLVPRLPKDAAAMIAFTASDLWPGDGWNFVFGQASLQNRVGVWSLNRNGNPDESDAAYRLCLLRTLKTATHETGHMLSIHHCTAYNCNMCGSNSLPESDRQTVAMCPECLPKLCTATGSTPEGHLKSVHAFFKAHKMAEQEALYEKLLKALNSAGQNK